MSRDGQTSNHVLQIIKFLKDVLSNDKKTYSEKVTLLVMTWERIASSGRRHRPLAAMCIVEVMFKDTLNILLHGDWPKMSPVNKTHLIQMLTKYKQGFTEGMLWLESKINKLIELVNDPWTLPSLERILHSNPSPATEDQIMEFCASERGRLLVTRLEMLCSNRCEKVAIKLAEACFQVLSIPHSQLKNLFTCFELNFIFDIYLCLLYKYKRVESIINLLKPFSLKEGYNTVLRLKRRSYLCKQKVWRFSSKVAEVVTRYFITVCMMSRSANTTVFKNLIREWLTFYSCTDMDAALENEVRKLVQTAEASHHIYCIAESVVELSHDRQTQAFRSLIMELYIRAVTSDINYLERVKLLADREEQTLCEKRLAEKFLALADLVKDHAGVRREFVLTAFSIHPSPEIYQRVEEEAIATGKALPQTCIRGQENLEMGILSEGLSSLSSEEPDVKDTALDSINNDSQDSGAYTEVKKERTLDALILIKGNIVTESLNYDVLAAPSHQVLEADKLGLSSQVCADLVTLLGSNRYQLLTWVLEWSELSTRCQRYIEEADSIKSDNKELKFLEIDYNKYKDWPENEDEYDCIEKGYEQWLEEESETEDYNAPNGKHSSTSDSEASMIKAAIRRSKKHTGRYAESTTDSDSSVYRRRTVNRTRRAKKRSKFNSDSDSVSGSLGSDGQKPRRGTGKNRSGSTRKKVANGRLVNCASEKLKPARKKINSSKRNTTDSQSEIMDTIGMGLPVSTPRSDPTILKSLRAFRPTTKKVKHKDMFKTMTKSALNAKLSKALKTGIENFSDCYVDLSNFSFDVKDFKNFYKAASGKKLDYETDFMQSLKNDLISPANIPHVSNNATVNVVHVDNSNNIRCDPSSGQETSDDHTSTSTSTTATTTLTTTTSTTSTSPPLFVNNDNTDVMNNIKSKPVSSDDNSQLDTTSSKLKATTSQVQGETNVVYKITSTQQLRSTSSPTFTDIQQAVNFYKNSAASHTSSTINNNDSQISLESNNIVSRSLLQAATSSIVQSTSATNSFTLQAGSRGTPFSIIGSLNVASTQVSSGNHVANTTAYATNVTTESVSNILRRGLTQNKAVVDRKVGTGSGTATAASDNVPELLLGSAGVPGVKKNQSTIEQLLTSQPGRLLNRNVIQHQNNSQVLTVSSHGVPTSLNQAPVRFFTPSNSTRNILMLDHNVRGIINPIEVRNSKPNQSGADTTSTSFKLVSAPAASTTVYTQRGVVKTTVAPSRVDAVVKETSTSTCQSPGVARLSSTQSAGKIAVVASTGEDVKLTSRNASFIRLEPVLRQTSSPKQPNLSTQQTTFIPTVLMRTASAPVGQIQTSVSNNINRSPQLVVANKTNVDALPGIFVTQSASSNTIHYTVASQNSLTTHPTVVDQSVRNDDNKCQQNQNSVVGQSQVIKQSTSGKHDVISEIPALVNISSSSPGNVESLLLVTSHASLSQPILTFTNANNLSKQYFPITQDVAGDKPQSHVIVQLPKGKLTTQSKITNTGDNSDETGGKKLDFARNRVKNKILIVKNDGEAWIPQDGDVKIKQNDKNKEQTTSKRGQVNDNDDNDGEDENQQNKKRKYYQDVGKLYSSPRQGNDIVSGGETSDSFLVQPEDNECEELTVTPSVTAANNTNSEKVYIIVQEPSFSLMKTSSLPKFNQVFRKSYQVKHKGEDNENSTTENIQQAIKCDKVMPPNTTQSVIEQTKTSNIFFRTEPNTTLTKFSDKQVDASLQVKTSPNTLNNESSPVYSLETVGITPNLTANINKQKTTVRPTLVQSLTQKLPVTLSSNAQSIATTTRTVKTQDTVPASTLIYAAARPQGQIVIGRVNNPTLTQGSSVVYAQPTCDSNQQPQTLLLATVPQRSRSVVPGAQLVRLPNASGVWRMAPGTNPSKILQIAQVARPQNLVLQSGQESGLLMPSSQPVFLHHVTSLPVKPVGVVANTTTVAEPKSDINTSGDSSIITKKIDSLDTKTALASMDNDNSSSPSIATPELETVALMKDIKEFENVFEETKLKFEMEEQQGVSVTDGDSDSEVKSQTLTALETPSAVCLTSPVHSQNHHTVLVQPQLMLHKPHMIITSPTTQQALFSQRIDKHFVDKDIEKRLLLTSKPKSVEETAHPSHLTVAYVSHSTTTPSTQKPLVVVTSYGQPPVSPAASITSQSSSSPNSIIAPSLSGSGCSVKSTTKSKVRSVKTVPNPAKSPPVAKPQQKPQEDASTTQKIFAILKEYAEQLRNSPDVNNRPAPRRRSNPPTSTNPKRKKNLCKNKESFSDGDEGSFSEDVTETLPSSEDSSSGVAVLQVCVSSSSH